MKRSTLQDRMNSGGFGKPVKIIRDKTIFYKIQEYIAYNMLWQKLYHNHPTDELNHLMLKMVDIEEEVLTRYGLPYTQTNSGFFQQLALKDDFKLADITHMLVELHKEAEKYLSSPAQTDIKLLELAQQNQTEIDEVLPKLKLKLKAEPYYLYLYEELFLTRKINAMEFFNDITIVAENKLSIPLNRLMKSDCWFMEDDFDVVSKMGLKYLDEFLCNCARFMEERAKNFKSE